MEFASDLQRQQLIMQSVTGAAFNMHSAGKGELKRSSSGMETFKGRQNNSKRTDVKKELLVKHFLKLFFKKLRYYSATYYPCN